MTAASAARAEAVAMFAEARKDCAKRLDAAATAGSQDPTVLALAAVGHAILELQRVAVIALLAWGKDKDT